MVREVLAATCKAPATANKHIAAMRGVLKEAWRAGLLSSEDYQRAVDLKPVTGRRVRPGRAVSRGDLQAVIAACHADPTAAGARDVALVTVLYATGARRSEASALDLGDWDAGSRVLRLLRKRNKEQLVPLLSRCSTRAAPPWTTGLPAEASGPARCSSASAAAGT
jgi:site-specific recombinase XerD